MTTEEHKARHVILHQQLDELVADWIRHTHCLPGKNTVMDLMEWSYKQTENPDDDDDA